jgi:DNA invertase Pin-like site-specific DNA recombinase
MKKQDKGVTALYERLSKDDELVGESNSIVNQKKMLEDYAKRNGYTNVVHYTDDGWSGANFDRPSWKQLVKDIEDRKVSAVLVKDMSRVGRDYLQVGFYTEVMFREKQVHFVAIANGVDSNNRESAEFAPFLNIMNEWYVRDTSRKITTVLRARGMSGLHTSGNCLYGYKKDPDDSTKWIIDEEAAEVVREIYRLCVVGNGPYTIARILADRKIDRPSYYQAMHDAGVFKTSADKSKRYVWRGVTVKDILTRKEYLGYTVNFKSYKESYKDKQRKKYDESEQVVFKNTQEPIIDKSTWQLVQKLLKTSRKHNIGGEVNALTGKMFCADCGAKMYNHRKMCTQRKDVYTQGKTHKRGPEDTYNCSRYMIGKQNYEDVCTSHRVQTKVVKELVLETIKRTCSYATLNYDEFLDLVSATNRDTKNMLVSQASERMKKNEKRSEEVNKLIRKLYEDNVTGKINDKIFSSMIDDYENELNQVDNQIENDRSFLESVSAEDCNIENFMELTKRYTEFDELTPTMINEFVDKIFVHKAEGVGANRTMEIDIYLNYVGLLEIPQEEIQLTEEEQAELEKERIRLEKKRASNRRYMARKREERKKSQEKNLKRVG